ncbi:MAG: hypothetical protein HOP17_08015 [Acidobacteria bacterium]|nr:hypothetical protein [Acidobacteriota bacterium]
MEIQILFFGAVADSVKSRQLILNVASGTTAAAAIETAKKEHPALASQKLLIAVNEEYADTDTILGDGDEVAVFTAVSGG